MWYSNPQRWTRHLGSVSRSLSSYSSSNCDSPQSAISYSSYSGNSAKDYRLESVAPYRRLNGWMENRRWLLRSNRTVKTEPLQDRFHGCTQVGEHNEAVTYTASALTSSGLNRNFIAPCSLKIADAPCSCPASQGLDVTDGLDNQGLLRRVA
jgi:hypothetical protein